MVSPQLATPIINLISIVCGYQYKRAAAFLIKEDLYINATTSIKDLQCSFRRHEATQTSLAGSAYLRHHPCH